MTIDTGTAAAAAIIHAIVQASWVVGISTAIGDAVQVDIADRQSCRSKAAAQRAAAGGVAAYFPKLITAAHIFFKAVSHP